MTRAAPNKIQFERPTKGLEEKVIVNERTRITKENGAQRIERYEP